MGRIKALDVDVVHKIAAGEVIVSPANALKELIENSIDAGATNVDVLVKDGGHKLLQITDNGSGIEEEDLPLLCQRFTTSKIERFQDLESVTTLGFRGEALASISHVSHLSVKTRTDAARTATVASFENGKLCQTKKSAGVKGTQISVEDLFYNVPLRMRALQGSASKAAEYQKILDVVSKYAIQYPGTFSCKRFQDNQPVVIHAAPRKEKIKKVYGPKTYAELLELTIAENPEVGLIKVDGFVTGVNYVSNRSIPYTFFVNNRLVGNETLSRAIRKVYQEHMPRGGSHAFVFLSIELKSQNVDVNVHPTKREVHFLYETEIVEIVCQELKQLLLQTGGSREFKVQSYISATTFPSGTAETFSLSQPSHNALDVGPKLSHRPVVGGMKPRYEYNLVRTDPRQQRVTSFTQRSVKLTARQPKESSLQSFAARSEDDEGDVDVEEQREEHENNEELSSEDREESSLHDVALTVSSTPSVEEPAVDDESVVSKEAQRRGGPDRTELRDAQLESVHDLIKEIKANASVKLLQLISEHTFIGVVDASRGLAAIQLDIHLYLVEYHEVFRELFYQISLVQFANFGTIHLGDGLSISSLLKLSGTDSQSSAMTDMAEMLSEYFNIVLKNRDHDWYLVQLPLLLPGYSPPIERLPSFIAELTTEVNWEYERECLKGVATALSNLHVPTTQTPNEFLETVFNTAKSEFVPSRQLLPCFVEIASLPGLYKVFERC